MATRKNKQLLRKLEESLEQVQRLVPKYRSIKWSKTLAARWISDFWGGRFESLDFSNQIDLDDLLEIDQQKMSLLANTEQFCLGYPANNALLWGARGTGKSSLIHALLNSLNTQGLRIVEVSKDHLAEIGTIAARLQVEPFRFLVVCDDLSFDEDDSGYKELKSALEGSVFKGTDNVLIYATSNRRHLVTEYMRDNLASTQVEGELHESEAIEEKISLSDRFGLWLSFHQFKQDQYLQVVEYWVKKLAQENGLKINWTQQLRQEALTWALNRGVRSGRTAFHFARDIVGKTLLKYAKT